jgi:20S proteasome alpha/beta subunit
MTVIAFDGKTMAADRMSGNQWTSYGRSTKIAKVDGHLIGGAGVAAVSREFIDWFRSGRVPSDYPAGMKDKDDSTTMLVITPCGVVNVYQRSPMPMVHDNTWYAIGSGQEVAAAVMHVGYDAVKAVEVACAVCTGCGGGIDVLAL